MGILSNAFHSLRVWTGLADATESHLTPSHGWLLPATVRNGPQDTSAPKRTTPFSARTGRSL
jgi:hypothetical protein